MSSAVPTIEQLRFFSSFNALSDEDLLVLGGAAPVRELRRGDILFQAGEIDAREIFLLTGRVRLVAEDGRERIIEANTPPAQTPLARLRPRQYTAHALTPVSYFAVDSDVLEALVPHGRDEDGVGYGVEELVGARDEGEEMLQAFQRDLEGGRFRLVSLPEVAINVRNLLDEPTASLRQLADAINRDTAIATKVVRAANSPVYFGAGRCDSVQAAVTRLGMDTTRQLVTGFALRDLFFTQTPLLRKLMEELWQQSLDSAAHAFVLARRTRLFEPERALLAGLLSHAGALAVVSYASNYPRLVEDEARLRQWIAALQGPAGALLLERWGFGAEMVEVANSSEDWARCPTTRPDLCDLVLLAKLHSYIGKRRKPAPPPLDQVPAYQKLAAHSSEWARLTPDFTLGMLAEAREQVEQARSLLAA